MADKKQLKILKQGVEVWNKWRKKNIDVKIDLYDADLRNAYLSKADLSNAYLSGANLEYADLIEANLHDARLSDAHLRHAKLGGAKLSGANLSRAALTFVNLSDANLEGAKLRGAKLSFANLYSAYLSGANLSDANLSNADLSVTDIRDANLGGANLSDADLRDANLRDANLSGANLCFADLTDAIFEKADLENTKFGGTKLHSTNLEGAKNLQTIHHIYSSSLDYSTIKRSGDLPNKFLRGCGWPDFMIDALKDQKGKGIEYYSCFISYSSKDDKFARKLHADLQDNGIRCWYAPHDMKTGDKIRDTIDQAIRLRDKLLLILSEDAINSSWVEKEVETAFEEETKKNTDILFPIMIDNSVMDTDKAWAADLRRGRHIGDFRNWKAGIKYNIALQKLIDHLKSGKVREEKK